MSDGQPARRRWTQIDAATVSTGSSSPPQTRLAAHRPNRQTTAFFRGSVRQSSRQRFRPCRTVPAETRAIVGDFNLAVVGVRQNVTYKILDRAVLSDDAG